MSGRVIIYEAPGTHVVQPDSEFGKYLPGLNLDDVGMDDVVIVRFPPNGVMCVHGPGMDELWHLKEDWGSKTTRCEQAYHQMRWTDRDDNDTKPEPVTLVEARARRRDEAWVYCDPVSGKPLAAYCDFHAAWMERREWPKCGDPVPKKLSRLPGDLTIYTFPGRSVHVPPRGMRR